MIALTGTLTWNGRTGSATVTVTTAPPADNRDYLAVKRATLWRPPAPAWIVAPSPDYSTFEAVTSRCREAGSHSDRDLLAAMRSGDVRREYRALVKVAGPLPPAAPFLLPAVGWTPAVA